MLTQADVSKTTRYEPTTFAKSSALHWAAFHGRISAVRLLLRHGADVMQKNEVRDVEWTVEAHALRRKRKRAWSKSENCNVTIILRGQKLT